MNRIILIGNGFDKASKLETDYDDFLLWYFKSIFEGKLESEETSDKFFYKDQLVRVVTPKNILAEVKKCTNLQELEELKSVFIHDFSKQSRTERSAEIQIHSKFFKGLIQQKTWGEIESEYFKALHRIKTKSAKEYNQRSVNDYENNRKKELLKLNNDFAFIRDTFSKYIKEVDSQIESTLDEKKVKYRFIEKCFTIPIPKHLNGYFFKNSPILDHFGKKVIHIGNSEIPIDQLLNKIVFINFNYTTNLSIQIDKFQEIGYNLECREIRIHGNITEEDERGIIFGYGDDTAKEYREIEQDGNNEYLRFMKSTQYFYDDRYKEIISYVNDELFELFVAGHSLSLSDRVLLKTIVEHENCKMIRFFHKGEYEDYRTLVGAMTRHFDDKIEMRNKFLPYDKFDTIS